MYCWQFACNGAVIMGRTWEEFQELINALSCFWRTSDRRKIIVYVHNFAYEFQFMRKWFQWRDVFAVNPRVPISAEICGTGIVFRCSLALSGMNLDTMAKSLRYFPDVQKKTGTLDYRVLRHSQTVLDETTVIYCIFDVIVVLCYIAQCADDEGGDIGKIPRTKTGYVRRRCRDFVLYHKQEKNEKKQKAAMFNYRRLMQDLTLQPAEYQLLRRTFAGGFAHANCNYVDFVQFDVRSMDFSSSYPACAVLDYFPMSRGRREYDVTEEQFEKLCECYCVVADVRFVNLKPRLDYEFYLSKSKCRDFVMKPDERGKLKICGLFDNGRVVSALGLTTSITEVDYAIMKQVYEWDRIEIGECYTYLRGRLPSDFVRVVADLYEGKTALKGVKGSEKEYALMKADLNSLYGMMVTDILRDILAYGDEEWEEPQAPDLAEVIEKYNKSFSRCTFYPWGIYITSWARFRLWSGILAVQDDYKYADTDSIKLTNYERHKAYFESYNRTVLEGLKAAAEYHKIPLSKFIPKTIKGVEKPLGVWDFDGDYTDFKTLGAKRYMYLADGELHCTIAGVNPQRGAEYFNFRYKGDLNRFTDSIVFPHEYRNAAGEIVSGTGKLTHSYDDCKDGELCGEIVDFQGRRAVYYERSFIHLEPADYSLTIGVDFAEFLTGGEMFAGV